MRRSLTIYTAPTVEPVTVAEAKAWAKIDTDDDDAVVAALIAAARQSAEEYLRRSLINQTWKLTVDLARSRMNDSFYEGTHELPINALYGDLPQEIELPKGPVQSITSVTTYTLANASSTYSTANYRLDTAGERLVLNYGCIWPSDMRAIGAVEILYVAGYGAAASAVPQAIRMGMMIHFASMYEQRGQCEDAMGIPPGAKQLYNQYRIMGERRG